MLFLYTRVWDVIPTPAPLSLEEFTVLLEIRSVLLTFWCEHDSPEGLVKMKIAGPFPRTSHAVGPGWDQQLHF